MTNQLLRWHLSRDNQIKLHNFCQKHRVKQEKIGKDEVVPYYKNCFYIRYYFANGAWVLVELLAGTKTKDYSVADHFQVVNYQWGTK
jgi:hypothetical protein